MPIHNPDRELLRKIIKSVKSQKFKGKIEIIKVEEGLGLAASLNYGIKKSKYKVIVSLHQDCLPSDDNWLSNLVRPLEKGPIVASVSDVFDVENQKKYTPLLDEKGCAYKKDKL